MLKLAFLVLLCTGALAQIPGLGNCPKVDVVQNFNVSKYLGVWYEAQKYFAIFEVGGKCITANYTLNSNGTVKVVNRQINSYNGKPSTIEGTASLGSNQTEAKLSIVFPSIPGGISAPYWILDTDYENYSIVFSCSNFALFHAKIIWILTRLQNPPTKIIDQAYKVLDKYNLNKSLLMKTNQEKCS